MNMSWAAGPAQSTILIASTSIRLKSSRRWCDLSRRFLRIGRSRLAVPANNARSISLNFADSGVCCPPSILKFQPVVKMFGFLRWRATLLPIAKQHYASLLKDSRLNAQMFARPHTICDQISWIEIKILSNGTKSIAEMTDRPFSRAGHRWGTARQQRTSMDRRSFGGGPLARALHAGR
jgi:hypothetical protein